MKARFKLAEFALRRLRPVSSGAVLAGAFEHLSIAAERLMFFVALASFIRAGSLTDAGVQDSFCRWP